jgi:hypothetical protein
MAQYLKPINDDNVGIWSPSTGTTLWSCIDETTPSDTDYIYSQSNQTGYGEVGLDSGTDPEVSTGHILKFRVHQNSGSKSVYMQGYLYQGTTLIASTANTLLTGTWTSVTHTLSGTEADSITDYTNLSIRIEITSNAGGNSSAACSWAEMEIPDASTSTNDSIVRGIRISGKQTDSLTRGLYLGGGLDDSLERTLHLSGSQQDSLERGLYLDGSLQDSLTRNLYLKGGLSDSVERGLHISGKQDDSVDRSIRITGSQSDSVDRGIYLEGIGGGSIERGLWLSGSDVGSVERGIRLSGVIGDSIERDIWLSGASVIDSWQDLANMSNNLSGNYILTVDLDSSSEGYDTYASSNANGGAGWIPIGNTYANRFQGKLFGNGHTISDIYINRTSDYTGLFGYFAGFAYDIGLENIDITTSGMYTGGFAGMVAGTTGIGSAGGVIERCYTKGSIVGTGSPFRTAGFVGGTDSRAIIKNSYSGCSITIPTDRSYLCGGFIGNIVPTANYQTLIEDCYSSCTHNNADNGFARIGGGGDLTITDCFYDSTLLGEADSYATGYPTSMVKSLNTYDTLWDIVGKSSHTDETWYIDDGNDYPRLYFEPKLYNDSLERGIYLSGVNGGNIERGLWISGQDSGELVRDIRLSGGLSDSLERGLYLKGAIDDYIDKNLYISGKESDSLERSIRLSGVLGGSVERSLWISGISSSSLERSIYLTGSLQDSEIRGLWIKGSNAESIERNLYISGTGGESIERSIWIKGVDSDGIERSIRITGGLSDSVERGLWISGGEALNIVRGVWISGKDTGELERSLNISGALTDELERALWIEGALVESMDRGLWIKGKDEDSIERTLYIDGAYVDSIERNIWIKGKDSGSITRGIYISTEGTREGKVVVSARVKSKSVVGRVLSKSEVAEVKSKVVSGEVKVKSVSGEDKKLTVTGRVK